MFRTPILAAGAALALSLPLHAQTPSIRVGQTVNGELTARDPKLEDDSHYDLYTFRGRRGERVTFTLRSRAFDAYLAFGRMAGGKFDSIRTDDDGAGGTDARVSVTLDADGEYAVRANSLAQDQTGAYTLSAEAGGAEAPPRAATPTPVPAPIAMGQTVNGTLSQSDARMDDDSYYDLYRFTARAGERVEVVLRSGAFDAYLAVGRMQNGEFESMKTDDDGAGNQDARVRMTLPSTGEYVIRANSLSEGETGAYTLTLGRAPALPPAPAPQAIRVGQTVNGTLSATDPVADDDSHYDAFAIQGTAGERLRITMRSSAFDAFLAFGQGTAAAFETIDTNDDGPGMNTDAQLDVTLPSSGRFVIRANSLGAGQTGAYTLTVARP
jgi:hypothetical protein